MADDPRSIAISALLLDHGATDAHDEGVCDDVEYEFSRLHAKQDVDAIFQAWADTYGPDALIQVKDGRAVRVEPVGWWDRRQRKFNQLWQLGPQAGAEHVYRLVPIEEES